MRALGRRRFIAALGGAIVVSGCGATASATAGSQGATAGAAAVPTAAFSVPAGSTPESTTPGPSPTPVSQPDAFAAVPAGAGSVMKLNGQTVAVYRDPQGGVTVLSPRCPHEGCTVEWNDTDKTWDCPCHGWRFHADGAIMMGRGNRGLSVIA